MNEDDDTDRIRRILRSEDETVGDLQPLPPLPDSDATQLLGRPTLDADNMPLPRRVDEIDWDGTRVTPAAYEPTTAERAAAMRATIPPATRLPSFDLKNINWRTNLGCLLRVLIALLFVLIVFALCMGSYL